MFNSKNNYICVVVTLSYCNQKPIYHQIGIYHQMYVSHTRVGSEPMDSLVLKRNIPCVVQCASPSDLIFLLIVKGPQNKTGEDPTVCYKAHVP